ncbi:hypothetical protein XACM_1110 [Xanthomonas euvesicatoria pv. citrumelo F1]|nr:hypothetical protein XACM_1110 [Xanthomonas euvesicatoria pv. citrumelo F1]
MAGGQLKAGHSARVLPWIDCLAFDGRDDRTSEALQASRSPAACARRHDVVRRSLQARVPDHCVHRQSAIASLASSARLPPIGKQPRRRIGAISQMRSVVILAFSHCE